MVKKKIKEKQEEGTFRKISKDKYILAGVITFLIFSLGLTLGFILEDYRYSLVEDINTEQEVNYLSLQLQYLYLDIFSNQNNCPILETALKETVKDLDESLSEVISYEEDNKGSETQKNLITRRYVLDNLRYWFLALESKRKCNLDIVPILYFYSTECPSCPNQGTVLTFFKNKFGQQVLVFPINVDLREEEPMVEITKSQFGITKVPTLVVDNKKYEGVMTEEKLQKIICSSLKDKQKCN